MSKIGLLFLAVIFLFSHDSKEIAISPEDPRPNVLFISIDDLNDWVGCLKGHPQVKTPNIDRLASMGTLFTNAHTQSPICNPSRTSVLTGYRPSTTGIYGLSPWIRDEEGLKDIVTLPQYFKKQGYKTFSGGKIYHGGYGRRDSDREFDSLGPPAGVKMSPPTKLAGITPGGNNPWVDWGSFPIKDEELQDWEIASWASDMLNGNLPSPFFLSVGFFLPHVPLYAPKEYFDLYPRDNVMMPKMKENDREDTPRASWYNHWDVPEPRWKWFQENNQDILFVRSYLAAISYMDQQLGRVLDALDKSDYKENTIIVLWSDHGFHLGEKEISGKNTLWEQSTRVPLIFAGKHIGIGKKVSTPAELLDIYPTLIDLCGFPTKEDLEGHSLLPQLKNNEAKRIWPAITTNNYNNHAVRTQNWRYIRYADGSEELYDLKSDPYEWTNLANSRAYTGMVDSLSKWLPKKNKEPYVGNYQRILEYKDKTPYWQGQPIKKSDTIPGI